MEVDTDVMKESVEEPKVVMDIGGILISTISVCSIVILNSSTKKYMDYIQNIQLTNVLEQGSDKSWEY